MKVITAPSSFENEIKKDGAVSLFLGGSIEQGKAEDWQRDTIDFLSQTPYADKIVLLNPRRVEWDASWPNTPDFPPFKEQVEWELHAQEKADILLYFFAKDTISPITLLELGLFKDKNPIVGCDSGYLRRGNVQITGKHFNFEVHLGLKAMLDAVLNRLK